jgi:hypothetical protein
MVNDKWKILCKAQETHLPKLRVDFLPNSLNILLSLALVYSTNPPVSVYGTA